MIIFTCLVVYICNVPIVCRNMELRIYNKSRLIEVCIDDQWYEATSSTTAASNSRSHKCCVYAHIQTNTPLDLISSRCTTAKSRSDKVSGCDDDLAVGLGTSLGLLLVVCGGSVFINILLVMRLKNSTTRNFKPSRTNE